MSTTLLIIVIAVVVIAAAAAWMFMQKQRSTKLQSRFGPEYQHALHEYGDRARAESALEKRAKRIEKYQIHPLTEQDRARFADGWRQAQARFVDDPPGAIHDADQLVCDAMAAQGYPMTDFEHRAEDLSVEHPHVIRNYRAAHNIALAMEDGRASTEDLRQAMVYYRDLFDDLLEAHMAGPRENRR